MFVYHSSPSFFVGFDGCFEFRLHSILGDSSSNFSFGSKFMTGSCAFHWYMYCYFALIMVGGAKLPNSLWYTD